MSDSVSPRERFDTISSHLKGLADQAMSRGKKAPSEDDNTQINPLGITPLQQPATTPTQGQTGVDDLLAFNSQIGTSVNITL